MSDAACLTQVLFKYINDRKELVRFGSVRTIIFPVRGGSACVFRTRRGSVRFGSVRFGSFPRPVPAGSEIKRFGSIRFGRFGSVSYSFLPREAASAPDVLGSAMKAF